MGSWQEEMEVVTVLEYCREFIHGNVPPQHFAAIALTVKRMSLI